LEGGGSGNTAIGRESRGEYVRLDTADPGLALTLASYAMPLVLQKKTAPGEALYAQLLGSCSHAR
jgi:hypothetical protein